MTLILFLAVVGVVLLVVAFELVADRRRARRRTLSNAVTTTGSTALPPELEDLEDTFSEILAEHDEDAARNLEQTVERLSITSTALRDITRGGNGRVLHLRFADGTTLRLERASFPAAVILRQMVTTGAPVTVQGLRPGRRSSLVFNVPQGAVLLTFGTCTVEP